MLKLRNPAGKRWTAPNWVSRRKGQDQSMKRILAGCLALVGVAGFCIAADAPGFKVTKKYSVPGDGGFDYIVFYASMNRLYVSHGTEVNVLDADSGKLLGTVQDTPGVHGIAIVPQLHRGFTSNGGDSTVTVFDTATSRPSRRFLSLKIPTSSFTIRKLDVCSFVTGTRRKSRRSTRNRWSLPERSILVVVRRRRS